MQNKLIYIIAIIVLGVSIMILSIININKEKNISQLKAVIGEHENSILQLEKEVENLKEINKKLISEVEYYKKFIETLKSNNPTNSYYRRTTSTTRGGVTTTTTTNSHNNCNEEISGSDDGEVIKKCGSYIVVKTFQGYVVAHTWGEGYIGDKVLGNIWWAFGWEDWLIECKKVNVKIELKGDWDEVNKWIQKNC